MSIGLITGIKSGIKSGVRSGLNGGIYSGLPETTSDVAAATGLTPQGLYRCDEFSGSLLDYAGTADDLAVFGSPVFRKFVGDRFGIEHTATSTHAANVHAIGTASAIYSIVYMPPSSFAFNSNVLSRVTAAFEGIAMYIGDGAGDLGNTVFFLTKDSAGTLLQTSVVVSGIRSAGVPSLFSIQIDRAAGLCRGRISRGGVKGTTSHSIAGFLTFDIATQEYRHGASNWAALQGSGTSFWNAAFTGTQCEGANKLADIAKGLGFE